MDGPKGVGRGKGAEIIALAPVATFTCLIEYTQVHGCILIVNIFIYLLIDTFHYACEKKCLKYSTKVILID